MKTSLSLLLFCFLFSAASGIAGAAEPYPVIVSILPQKYLAERIGGQAIKVTALVGPGAEPHTYEPTPTQMREASRASIYFTLGLPFEESWVPRLAGAAPNLAVISTIEGIVRTKEQHHHDHGENGPHGQDAALHHEDEEHDHDHDHGHGHDHGTDEDPHTWLSPRLVRKIAAVMTDHLCEALPAHAETFRANAAVLDKEIEDLDRTIIEKFKPFPPENRFFLTFHPSWGYFAADYDLTELAIEVEGKEPSAKAMVKITDEAKRHGLKTIFIEPQFSRSAAKAIAENIGAKIVEANPLEENWFTLMNTFADALAISFSENRPPR